MEEPESVPQSLQKSGALYFRSVEPVVVGAIIAYLKRGENSLLENDFGKTLEDPLFYVQTDL